MKQFAAIDIGTNTVRLIIMEVDSHENFREIDSERVICRLGEGIHLNKRLLPHRMEMVIDVLNDFKAKCKTHGNIPIQVVATSAVREASNKNSFIEKVKEITGLNVNVISWEEEAQLTLQGVFWKLPDEGKPTIIFDIGGGSTEFIYSKGKKIVSSYGTFLGVVRLTERFITQHPILDEEYYQLENFLTDEFRVIKEKLNLPQPEVLIGTAGTVTTLAAMDQNIFPYDPDKVHGMLLPEENIQKLMENLKSKSLEERLKINALERGREDLIIAGTAIVLATMQAFQCPLLTVSEYSLREGILLNAYNHSK